MRRTYKKLIALCAVLVFGLSLIPVIALAQDPFSGIAIGGLGGLSGAGLFGSMAGASGINIGYTSDPVNDAMWNKLNPDSVYFNGEKHEATGIGEDIYDYIQIDIGDWLAAQSDFITEFATQYNVTDNSSGNTENITSFNGIPFTDTYQGAKRTAILDTLEVTTKPNTYTMSSSGCVVTLIYENSSSYGTIRVTYNNTVLRNTTNTYLPSGTYKLRFMLSGSNVQYSIDYNNQDNNWNGDIGQIATTNNINWTSETVELDKFDNWDSAIVKIEQNQLITGWTIADFLDYINELWQQGNEDQIIVEEGTIVPPTPTPTPIPTTPLGEVPFDEWMDTYGQHVIDNQDQIGETINDIPGLIQDNNDTLDNIDQNIDDATDTLESIDTNIGVGNGILGGIRSLLSGISETLSDIADSIAELVQEVVLATETFISGLLNTIPQAFSGWFQAMKQSFSIWHYVVEWFGSISGVFSWFWSVASGTSYYIVLPIYASLAGAVVLAFYKRFGK